VQDHDKLLQDQCDKYHQHLSGVGGGEVGELANLLISMREAGDDLE